jgi:hypothetical protein
MSPLGRCDADWSSSLAFIRSRPGMRTRANLGVVVLGLGLIAAGLLCPGSKSGIATTLIIIGSGAAVLGFLHPAIEEFQIGPTGLKTSLRGGEARPQPLLVAEGEKLVRLGWMACADLEVARELVEAVMAKTERYKRRIAKGERDAFRLKSLIELLDTAAERRWLRGPSLSDSVVRPAPETYVAVLQNVAFLPRICFLLHAHADWTLPPRDIASVLDRPPEQIEAAIEEAREVLRPLMDDGEGVGS